MKESGRSRARAVLVVGAGHSWGWRHWWGMGPLVSTLTFIAETTLECRNHAGVLAAAAPETACSAETTLAFRDHGAGAVASERQRGFDAAGRPSASRQVTGASQSKG